MDWRPKWTYKSQSLADTRKWHPGPRRDRPAMVRRLMPQTGELESQKRGGPCVGDRSRPPTNRCFLQNQGFGGPNCEGFPHEFRHMPFGTPTKWKVGRVTGRQRDLTPVGIGDEDLAFQYVDKFFPAEFPAKPARRTAPLPAGQQFVLRLHQHDSARLRSPFQNPIGLDRHVRKFRGTGCYGLNSLCGHDITPIAQSNTTASHRQT